MIKRWVISQAISPQYAPIIWDDVTKSVVCSLFYETGNGEYAAYSAFNKNGPLIASAPCLLEALDAVFFFASVIKSGEPFTDKCQEALDKAKAAISRATGGSDE